MNKRNKTGIFIGVLLAILIGIRIYLPYFLTDYVNKVIDDIPGYTGGVADIRVNLIEGAYVIEQLQIHEEATTTGVPFFDSEQIHVSVQWSALFNGAIVGELDFHKPQLNFMAHSKEADTIQTNQKSTDWTEPIKELIPLQINKLTIYEGQVHFLDTASKPSVDIYLSQLNAQATNLSNATDKDDNLPSHISGAATSIGNGDLRFDMDINVLKAIPDFDFDLEFEDVDLLALNDFIKAYSKIDVEEGQFHLYMELAALDGQIEGYIKPIIENLKIVKWKNDKDEPLKMMWEVIASLFIEVFENQSKDRFASKVPIRGSLDDVDAKTWPAFINMLKNAYFEALEKNTDQSIKAKKEKEKEKK